MSDGGASERESEHPLFRVLVLMGGSLALGCGGSAVIDGGAGGSAPAGSNGGAAQAGAPQAGAAQAGGGAAQGGAAQAGSGGSSGVADCPPAQWDCSALAPTCSYNLPGVARPAGCVCDLKRPKSVADCSATEDLICLPAYNGDVVPQTWDGSRHVQCACVPGPSIPTYDQCAAACVNAYPTAFPTPNRIGCTLPSTTTCDSSGNNCTATAADVLRQDGIVCGCAPVILK